VPRADGTCLFYQILRLKSIHNSKKDEIFKTFFIIPIDFYTALCYNTNVPPV